MFLRAAFKPVVYDPSTMQRRGFGHTCSISQSERTRGGGSSGRQRLINLLNLKLEPLGYQTRRFNTSDLSVSWRNYADENLATITTSDGKLLVLVMADGRPQFYIPVLSEQVDRLVKLFSAAIGGKQRGSYAAAGSDGVYLRSWRRLSRFQLVDFLEKGLPDPSPVVNGVYQTPFAIETFGEMRDFFVGALNHLLPGLTVRRARVSGRFPDSMRLRMRSDWEVVFSLTDNVSGQEATLHVRRDSLGIMNLSNLSCRTIADQLTTIFGEPSAKEDNASGFEWDIKPFNSLRTFLAGGQASKEGPKPLALEDRKPITMIEGSGAGAQLLFSGKDFAAALQIRLRELIEDNDLTVEAIPDAEIQQPNTVGVRFNYLFDYSLFVAPIMSRLLVGGGHNFNPLITDIVQRCLGPGKNQPTQGDKLFLIRTASARLATELGALIKQAQEAASKPIE